MNTSLLSTEDVSKQYNLPKRLLIEFRSNGNGPIYIKVSYRCVRYRRSDVEKWIEERAQRFTHSA